MPCRANLFEPMGMTSELLGAVLGAIVGLTLPYLNRLL